ncbi:hypothetical protein IVB15_07570 [Bradyrhizobium sp. 182]|nr:MULTISPECIES: hypothetical protein [unclassified Bradyrhizobium]MCK1419642.1 hypothetical protein [Bradyrhizobium sp. CW12]MCK1527603.1 hypothetical protein [Bradyrhizobium sp. 182]MCK1644741.1 hypothetical protein [Bradyrhizobium sp. 154]
MAYLKVWMTGRYVEESQSQVARLNELLVLRLDQLTAADRLLQEMLPYT